MYTNPVARLRVDAVDDGSPTLAGRALERQQIDIEDLVVIALTPVRAVTEGWEHRRGRTPPGTPPVWMNTTSLPSGHRPGSALPSRPAKPLPL